MLHCPARRTTHVLHPRTLQFTEDGGPMAHPVRPDSYIKMDNFYTLTVYNKVRVSVRRCGAYVRRCTAGSA